MIAWRSCHTNLPASEWRTLEFRQSTNTDTTTHCSCFAVCGFSLSLSGPALAMAMALLIYAPLVARCGSYTPADFTDSIHNKTTTPSLNIAPPIEDYDKSRTTAVMDHLAPRGDVRLPNLPSPTNVQGPVRGFQHPDPAVITAARGPIAHQERSMPRGFVNHEGHLCYRNALLVLLLCSERFMSYIQNHHISNVIASAIPNTVQPTSPLLANIWNFWGRESSPPPMKYTDILTRINDLWEVYWAHSAQEIANTAMAAFWQYFAQVHEDGLGVMRWEFIDQQDPADLFLNFMTIARAQMRQQDTRLRTELFALNSMIQSVRYVYRRCSLCRLEKNVKIRTDNEVAHIWQVSIDEFGEDPKTGRRYRRQVLDLRNLLHRNLLKEIAEPWHCGPCGRKWRKRAKDMSEKAGENKEQTRARRDQMAKYLNHDRFSDFVWQRYVQLPEALCMQMIIFDAARRKIHVRLTIPEELDVAQYVDQEEFEGSTRYRLVGVICHQGTGIQNGHYICYVKHREQWWYINDEAREPVSFAEINDPRAGRSAYMLLWEKIAEAEIAERNLNKQASPIKEVPAPIPAGNTTTGPKTAPPAEPQPSVIPYQQPITITERTPEVPKRSGQISGTYIIDGHRISYCLDIPYIPDVIPRTYAPGKNATPSSKLKSVTIEHEGHIRLYPGPDADGHNRMKHPIANALLTRSVNAIDDVKPSQVHYTAWFNWYNNIPDAKGGVYHPLTRERKEVWQKRVAVEAAQAAKDAEPRRRAAAAAIRRNGQSNPPEPKSPMTVIQPVSPSKKKPKTKDAGTDPKTPPSLEKSKIQGVALSHAAPNHLGEHLDNHRRLRARAQHQFQACLLLPILLLLGHHHPHQKKQNGLRVHEPPSPQHKQLALIYHEAPRAPCGCQWGRNGAEWRRTMVMVMMRNRRRRRRRRQPVGRARRL